jgi:hypothetical protein
LPFGLLLLTGPSRLDRQRSHRDASENSGLLASHAEQRDPLQTRPVGQSKFLRRRLGGGGARFEHQPHAMSQPSDLTIFRASRINDRSRRRCSLASAVKWPKPHAMSQPSRNPMQCLNPVSADWGGGGGGGAREIEHQPHPMSLSTGPKTAAGRARIAAAQRLPGHQRRDAVNFPSIKRSTMSRSSRWRWRQRAGHDQPPIIRFLGAAGFATARNNLCRSMSPRGVGCQHKLLIWLGPCVSSRVPMWGKQH